LEWKTSAKNAQTIANLLSVGRETVGGEGIFEQN
jgi:hypothetical protein